MGFYHGRDMVQGASIYLPDAQKNLFAKNIFLDLFKAFDYYYKNELLTSRRDNLNNTAKK